MASRGGPGECGAVGPECDDAVQAGPEGGRGEERVGAGFTDVRALQPWQTTAAGDLAITAAPGNAAGDLDAPHIGTYPSCGSAICGFVSDLDELGIAAVLLGLVFIPRSGSAWRRALEEHDDEQGDNDRQTDPPSMPSQQRHAYGRPDGYQRHRPALGRDG